MTDLTHPLTPWSHAECVDLIRQQIDRNTRERDRKIVDLYCSGQSMRQVADQFSLSQNAIYLVLHRDAPDIVRPQHYHRKGGDAATNAAAD